MRWHVAWIVLAAAAASATPSCTSLDGLTSSATDAGSDADGGSPPIDAAPAGCGDTRSDPKNCGRCKHDCVGGACEAGSCKPVVLALGQANPEALAIAGDELYWTNLGDGTVSSVSLSGGSPKVRATNQSPRGLAVAQGTVYWTNVNAGTIARLPASGSVEAFVTLQDTPYDLAVDGTFVAWVNRADTGALRFISLPSTALVGDIPAKRPTALALDATSVYWVEEGTSGGGFKDGALRRVARSPGAVPEMLGSNLARPRGIAVGADGVVYYSLYADGVIASHSGSAPSVLVASRFQPAAIALDGTNVYWVDEYDGGSVNVAPKAGGPPIVLASGQAVPHAIAVDEQSVIWATSGDGRIQRIAKP